MGQMNFAINAASPYNDYCSNISVVNSLYFHGVNFADSISLNQVQYPYHIGWSNSSETRSFSFKIGLYSLNVSTLSLANTLSQSFTLSIAANNADRNFYLNFTSASVTQNITPGTWYFGILNSWSASSNNDNINPVGQNNSVYGKNSFPLGFIAGRYTVTTAALPAAVCTSDCATTGPDIIDPVILLTA